MHRSRSYTSAPVTTSSATVMLDANSFGPANTYYFELIGECYVHGMMNGDAIGWQNEKGIKPMVFELR